ncbi:glycosyltransferase [Winogradskyella litorisediminis]|uniref:Glycosyltransferase n=1 Tax=Winogradskyella litorisediminis TaxID=1156618 RepID=A0ABW3N5I9_9FLAO
MAITAESSSNYNHKMTTNPEQKRILVAPLHWGLGHATRCIPIIKALLEHNFEPIIASDGAALDLLKKEFPILKFFELPSYNISYPKNEKHLKWHFLKSIPHFLKTIKREKAVVKKIVETEKLTGIISDNRFGVWHNEIPCVYITHQINVLSGNTTWLTSKIHQNIIAKFDECWIPDFESKPNLSGKLGHPKAKFPNLKYIGPLSRFHREMSEETIDKLVILSGPEPQRSILEGKLISLLKSKKENIVIVRGIVEEEQNITEIKNIKLYNFMTSIELESTIIKSKLVISRSGYTTIMDLAKLKKKAIFIPTPGQFEQLYLAEYFLKLKIIPSFLQDNITAKDLEWNPNFSGFKFKESVIDFENLFSLF